MCERERKRERERERERERGNTIVRVRDIVMRRASDKISHR